MEESDGGRGSSKPGRMGGKKPGWQPEGEIPSYILKDGAYPQMDSLLIGEKYEQFNEKGENVSRTVIFEDFRIIYKNQLKKQKKCDSIPHISSFLFTEPS